MWCWDIIFVKQQEQLVHTNELKLCGFNGMALRKKFHGLYVTKGECSAAHSASVSDLN